MSTITPKKDGVEQIGDVAGDVWHTLNDVGPLSPAQLSEKVSAPRDLIMQAIGWLAREGKLDIASKGRRKLVTLK